MISDDLTKFVDLTEDHYWGSLEKESDIILQHIYAIVKMVIKDNEKKYNDACRISKQGIDERNRKA